MWRKILIEWPVKAVTWYLVAYRALLALSGLIVVMILIPILIIELVLWLFGIRWGW